MCEFGNFAVVNLGFSGWLQLIRSYAYKMARCQQKQLLITLKYSKSNRRASSTAAESRFAIRERLAGMAGFQPQTFVVKLTWRPTL